MTIIQCLNEFKENNLYIKREDMMPFSFGGNKARKAQLFFFDIDRGGYDCVVTYGSGSSNHCRVVANECCKRAMKCYIIAPMEASDSTFNSQMMKMFGAEITIVPVDEVHDTIEKKIRELLMMGRKPYFIEGGGHGNIGTEAYVQCYEEITEYERINKIHFDYIFLASGTGTTQAGLVCGKLLNGDEREIIGISVARENPRGRDVVIQSICDYLDDKICDELIQESTIFIDDYTSGYAKEDCRVAKIISMVMSTYGIPLDPIYTGKAFMGMSEYIEKIKGKNILFIHTGGTPLFFDFLRKSY